MIKLFTFIAFLYLLVELVSRTEQAPDGKVSFKNIPKWFALINGIFNPSAKSSVVEVEVKTIDDESDNENT